MLQTRKTGILLIVVALLLPSAALPLITEYHPEPGICFTSNVFSNLGNMAVSMWGRQATIPYKYLYVISVILGCVGIGLLALSSRFLALGSRGKKIGIILILAGLCLPVVVMPYITEFRPQPDICLSSNFFGNFRSMVVDTPFLTIPYRYLFVLGINITCIGMATVVLSSGKAGDKKP